MRLKAGNTMDDSPRLLSKRPNRLSITKSKKGPASPTTSCQISVSPQMFGTPPSKRLHGDSLLLYSTPVNQRIRPQLLDESPSQDYDIEAPCSQDDRESVLDVGWKWESHASNIAKKIIKNQPRRVIPMRVIRSQRSPHVVKLPVSGEKKGFYKFKEELSKLLSNGVDDSEHDSSLDDGGTGEMELTFTQGEGDDARPWTLFRIIESIELKKSSEQHSDGTKENLRQSAEPNKLKLLGAKSDSHSNYVPSASLAAVQIERKFPIAEDKQSQRETNLNDVNLFDQSDLDNLLLQCSQKVEDNYREQTKKPNVETNSLFGNDSFDDLFLSVPIDEKLVQNVPSKNCRSPLVRHRSMPAKSPVIKNMPVRVTSTLIRHNSMPTNDNQQSANILAECSKNINCEWDTSGKRRCTAEEIEKKRLEALQRREASKLKKISSCPSSMHNSINTSKVKR